MQIYLIGVYYQIMKRKSKLFTLIKTMNKGEKRAFKLFAKRYNQGENAYSRLFDVMNKEEEYDAPKIQSKLGVKSMKSGRLSVLKSQLFTYILSGLRNYKEDTYHPYKLDKLISFSDELMVRGMYDSSLDYLNKAHELARTVQNFRQLDRILDKKIGLLRRTKGANDLNESIEGIKTEKNICTKKLELENRFKDIYQSIYHLYRTKGISVNEDLKNQYDSIYHSLSNISSDDLSVKSHHLKLHVETIYFFAIGNMDMAMEVSRKQVELLDENSFFMLEHPDEYLKALNNTITVLVSLGEYDDAGTYIDKVWSLKESSNANKFINQRIFEIVYSNKLNIYVERGMVDKGLEMVPEIEKGIKEFLNVGLTVDRNLRLSLGVALLYFWKGEYDNALNWLSKIDDLNAKAGGPVYVVGYARILSILTHYELGNLTLLESLVRGTNRFLKKNNRLFETESMLLKVMGKLGRTNPDSQDRILTDFHNNLSRLLSDSSESNQFINSSLRIPLWLESKLTGQPIQGLIAKVV